jgi:DnaJ-class molecular chaperone
MSGKVRGIALSGRAGETWERIFGRVCPDCDGYGWYEHESMGTGMLTTSGCDTCGETGRVS